MKRVGFRVPGVGCRVTLALIVIAAVLPVRTVQAASARSLVRDGNAELARAQYDDALAAYEEAGVDMPESAHLYFNKGVAHYRKGDYDKAVESFEQASLKTKDLELEAKARFNLGNCAFRESERQRDSDLKKSLAQCEQSIRLYQEALELKPDFTAAAENIEVVRLVMKSILDEIKKQEEAAKKQQEQQQQAAEKLRELIEKQQVTADKTQAADTERKDKGDSQETRQKIDDLKAEQEALRDETQQVAQQMSQPQQQQPSPSPPPADQVREHVEQAVGKQTEATESLRETDTETARGRQEAAIEELKKALDAMSGDQQGDQQQQQEQEQEQEQQQESAGQQPQPNEGQEEKQEQQQAMAALDDKAQDILDEEKENERRRQQASGGYTAVDKDW